MPALLIELLAPMIVPLLTNLLQHLEQSLVDEIEHLITGEQLRRNPVSPAA